MKNGNTTKAGATFTGVAERGGRVLLVTVMNPENGAHNEVYKEAAKLLDWGFSAAGKATPVGELVAPVGAESDDSGSGTPTAAPVPSAEPVAASAVRGGSGGMGVALGMVERPAGAGRRRCLAGQPPLAAAGFGAAREGRVIPSSALLPVAVQEAQYSTSLAVKLIHSSSATGTPKAPYMLFAATPWR